MKRFWAFLLFCLILNSGNLQPRIIETYFEEHINQKYKDSCVIAMNEWQISTNNSVYFHINENISYIDYINLNEDSLLIRDGSYFDESLRDFYEVDEMTIAFAYYKEHNQIVFIRETVDDMNLSKDQLTTVATHELGHIIGLWHSRRKDSIMYPTLISDKFKLSKKDIEFYCGVNFCFQNKKD